MNFHLNKGDNIVVCSYRCLHVMLQKMVASFHIPELQILMGLLKMNKYGRKADLLQRAQAALSRGVSRQIQEEIRELYRYLKIVSMNVTIIAAADAICLFLHTSVCGVKSCVGLVLMFMDYNSRRIFLTALYPGAGTRKTFIYSVLWISLFYSWTKIQSNR